MTAKRESTLRSRIVRRLRARGWLALVQHGGAYSQVGASDIIGCAAGRFFALEVKTAAGATTPMQEAFLRGVRSRGGIAGVVRTPQEAEDIVLAGLETPPMPEMLEDLGLDDLDLDSVDIEEGGYVEVDLSKGELIQDVSEPDVPPHVEDALWADATARDAIIERAVADASDDLFADNPPSDGQVVRVGDVAGTDPLGALCARLDVLIPGLVESVGLLTEIIERMRDVGPAPAQPAAPSRKRAPRAQAQQQAQEEAGQQELL